MANQRESLSKVVLRMDVLQRFDNLLGIRNDITLVLQCDDRSLLTLIVLFLKFAALEDLHELRFDDLKLLDCDPFKGKGLLVMLTSDRADHEALGLLELSELCGINTFRERDGLVVENHNLMAVLVDEGSLSAEMEGLVFVNEVVLSDFEDVDFQFAAQAVDDPAHDLDTHLSFISAVLLFLEYPNLEILDPGAENVYEVENFDLILWDSIQS